VPRNELFDGPFFAFLCVFLQDFLCGKASEFSVFGTPNHRFFSGIETDSRVSFAKQKAFRRSAPNSPRVRPFALGRPFSRPPPNFASSGQLLKCWKNEKWRTPFSPQYGDPVKIVLYTSESF
jgi:hypothetical protein